MNYASIDADSEVSDAATGPGHQEETGEETGEHHLRVPQPFLSVQSGDL